MPTIIFNGKQYSNPAEMPPEVRQAYDQAMSVLADQNGDGMPDILQLTLPGQFDPLNTTEARTTTSYVYNGQIYTSLNDLPPEARRRYEQAGAAWDANQNGIPDFLEQSRPMPAVAQPPARPVQPASYASIEPEGVNLRGLLTGAAIAVFVMLLIGVALVLSGIVRLP